MMTCLRLSRCRIGVVFVGMTFVGILLATPAVYAEAHGAAAGLHINWWTWDSHAPPMGWFLVDFGVFLAGLIYFMARPVAIAFRERHMGIKRDIADAAAAHAKASQAQHDARRRLAGLEAEIRELLAASQADGEAERGQMVKDADAYAARMRADTHSMAEQEVKRARLRLQVRTLQAALLRTEAILVAELGPQDQQNLLDRSIDDMRVDANWQVRRPHAPGASVATRGAT